MSVLSTIRDSLVANSIGLTPQQYSVAQNLANSSTKAVNTVKSGSMLGPSAVYSTSASGSAYANSSSDSSGSSGGVSYSGAGAVPVSAAAVASDPKVNGLDYGSLLSSAFGLSSATRFEEAMANTAHQREVKDLIAAGLNPVLSAHGGNGAPIVYGMEDVQRSPIGAGGRSSAKSQHSVFGQLAGDIAGVFGAKSAQSTAISNVVDFAVNLFKGE